MYCGVPSCFVSPTNVANVPASDDVISMRSQSGEATRVRGTLATTTFLSVMSTRWVLTVTKRPCSAACLPFFGAVPSTIPPLGGIDRITSHGTVADMVTGVSEISGAVTLLS